MPTYREEREREMFVSRVEHAALPGWMRFKKWIGNAKVGPYDKVTSREIFLLIAWPVMPVLCVPLVTHVLFSEEKNGFKGDSTFVRALILLPMIIVAATMIQYNIIVKVAVPVYRRLRARRSVLRGAKAELKHTLREVPGIRYCLVDAMEVLAATEGEHPGPPRDQAR